MEFEFGYLVDGFWVGGMLVVVFYYVDEIRGSKEACEGGGLCIP